MNTIRRFLQRSLLDLRLPKPIDPSAARNGMNVKAIRNSLLFCILWLTIGWSAVSAGDAGGRISPQAPSATVFSGSDPTAARTQMLAAMNQKLRPRWRDMTPTQTLQHIASLAGSLLNTSSSNNAAAAPVFANFVGNLTGITTTAQALILQRQNDCSLSLGTGTWGVTANGDPTVSVQAITTGYEKTLHSAAQLATHADVFASGCSEATAGISSRPGVFLGKTTQNLYLFAASGYSAINGSNALFYFTVDASTNTIHSTNLDTSEPNIGGVTAGDLTGDGLADVVSIDKAGTNASISVRIAHVDGSLSAAVAYTVPGSMDEAAVVDDVNGDGKLDVIVASIDSNTQQETISVLTGNGDGTLNKAVSLNVTTPTATGSNAYAIPIVNLITADLRGSGHKDLIASNGLVLLNKGDGTFTVASAPAFPPRAATSNFGPNLAAGDLNKDHKTDLVVSNGSEIDIYLGNGDGTFTTAAGYASIGTVGYVTITDLDGDGNPDVYVGLGDGGFLLGDQYSLNQTYALMGNGDGSFRGAPIAPAAFTGHNMADLNGDKKLDLVGLSGAIFTTYLGKGDGTFSTGASVNASSFTSGGITYNNAGVTDYALADVNGDGYPDLIWVTGSVDNSTARTFYFVALNKHDGSFAAPSVFEFPTLVSGKDFETYFTVGSVQSADFNHDGKADLVFSFSEITYYGTSYQLGYFVLPGRGDGSFGSPIVLITGTASSSLFSPPQPPLAPTALVDFDGDHFPDLLAIQYLGIGSLPGRGLGTQLSLYRGKGDGSFAPGSVVPTAPNPFTTPGQVVVADMNGDGHPDLVALGQAAADGSGQLSISLGKGDGTFASPTTYVLQSQGITVDGLAIADFDGDGKNDVALTNFEVPGGILFGNGDGTLATPNANGASDVTPTQQFIIAGGGSTIVADLNGDGATDIISGNVLLLNQNGASGGGSGDSGYVNLNQHGLTGSWYNPLTSGQGLLLEVVPDMLGAGQGLLFGGWFTYDVGSPGGAETQRWYSVQGPVSSTSGSATIPIYVEYGGNFNAPPKLPAGAQVGTITVKFSDCTHGSLVYNFTDGSARMGTIPLTRLSANVSCSPSGDSGADLSDFALAGTYYDPTTSGQGMLFDISPSQNVLFAAWYTFTPDGATTGGPASQRWYTLQATFSPGVNSLSNLPIYATTGGVFDNPAKATSTQVGTSTLSFSSCSAATVQYTFTAGTNQGLSGTVKLTRLDPVPADCSL